MHQQYTADDLDFPRDVIGDDLVVGGVVYDSAEWVYDLEDGVRRRTDTADVSETFAQVERRIALELRSRAAALAADYAATAANLSTGSAISDLRDRHAELVREADAVGFDLDIIEEIIDAALAPAGHR